GHTMAGGRLRDGIHVDRIRVAPEEPPAGRGAEHVHERILERPQQTVGHLLAGLVETPGKRGKPRNRRGQTVVREERGIGVRPRRRRRCGRAGGRRRWPRGAGGGGGGGGAPAVRRGHWPSRWPCCAP